jgi:hypothetical protein
MNRSTAPLLDAPPDERAGHASNYTEADLRAFDALNSFSSDKIKSTTGSSKSTLNNSTIDYTETDPTVALDGHIGLQIHSGGPALAPRRRAGTSRKRRRGRG